MDVVFRVFELLGRIPGWIWIVMTVLFVAYQIDRRLEYIWKLVYELPERLERSRRLQEADADSGEGESAVRAGQQQE